MNPAPSKTLAPRGLAIAAIIVLLLLGLPLAVWADQTNLPETNLRRQASDINSMISSVRAYYASNVVGRVLSGDGKTQAVHT